MPTVLGQVQIKLGKSSRKKDWKRSSWAESNCDAFTAKNSADLTGGQERAAKLCTLRQQVLVFISLHPTVTGCGLPLGKGGGVTLGEVAVFS